LAEEVGDLLFRPIACCYRQHELFSARGQRAQVDTVHSKENERSVRASSFVAIREWMVRDNVKKVSCGHRSNVGMKEFSIKRLQRLRNGGFQEVEVQDFIRPSKFGDLKGVYLQRPL